MALVAVTAAQVQKGSGTSVAFGSGEAGAAITAGQPIYLDSSNAGKVTPALAATEAEADCKGIAVADAAAGQICPYQRSGSITLGADASLTQGKGYWLSTTTGRIGDESDIDGTDFITFLGVASSTSVLDLNIFASGVTT